MPLKIFPVQPILYVQDPLQKGEGAVSTPLRQVRVEDPETARTLLHPLRARILERMREPASATEVARQLGLPPTRVNHHVRKLHATGLLRRAGTRRVRNLSEILYVAQARTFVLTERLTPGGGRRGSVRKDEARRPLRNLVALGERLAGDSLQLLDEVAWDDREFSLFATAVDLSFADAVSRAAFLADLLESVQSLREKYGADRDAPPSERYRTVIACYPEVGTNPGANLSERGASAAGEPGSRRRRAGGSRPRRA